MASLESFGRQGIIVVLLAIIFVQWAIIHTHILQKTAEEAPKVTLQPEKLSTPSSQTLESPQEPSPPPGVFVTIIYRAPKWMHLRYTLMIQNALANLPKDWKLHIFVNRKWADREFLPWHANFLERWDKDRVILTDLPSNLTQGKPKFVLLSEWFWKTVAADSVILFTGNGAFCANHKAPTSLWERMEQLDWMGAPSRHKGGDASGHSFRNRQAMLRALENAQQLGVDLAKWGDTEAHFFQKYLPADTRYATRQDTLDFAGVHNLSSTTGLERLPMVVTGTHADLSWDDRESLLKHCPEIKMIFPSLHEPACFGAHPKPEACRATICALQTDIPPHGC